MIEIVSLATQIGPRYQAAAVARHEGDRFLRVFDPEPLTLELEGENQLIEEGGERTSRRPEPRDDARRTVEAIERQVRERTEAGLALDGLPDLSAEGERDGFYQAQLIRELAVRHVTSWTGVELEGGPAPPTPEHVAAVMELYPVGERFYQEFTLRQVLLNAAKNGSGPSAAGTSSRVEGPSTAGRAATMASPAPEASQEPTDGSAPTASTP